MSVLALRCCGLIFAIALVSGSVTYAQEGVVPRPDEEFLNAVMTLYEGGRVPAEFLDDIEAYVREKLEWEREKIQLSREVIARTNRTALVGMVIVHAAVIVGFLAALLEFFHAWRLRKQGAGVAEYEVRIGLEGVAVKTSLYGLLILLVASGFYLMFVKFVYPVQVIGQ